MATATFQFTEHFVEQLSHGVHDLASDQLAVALTNSAPNLATVEDVGDITEVSYDNLSSRNVTTTSATQTDGVLTLALQELVLTASGGTVGPFRYVVLVNTDAPNDEVIGVLDYGEEVTLQEGQTLTIAWPSGAFTIGVPE